MKSDKVDLAARLSAEKISMEDVASLLDHLKEVSLKMLLIKLQTAKKHGIKIEDLTGSSQRAAIVRARDAAIARCKMETGATLQQIASSFNRNRSTIIHSLNK